MTRSQLCLFRLLWLCILRLSSVLMSARGKLVRLGLVMIRTGWTLSSQVKCHGHYVPPRVPSTTPPWVLATVPWLMKVSLWVPTLQKRRGAGGC